MAKSGQGWSCASPDRKFEARPGLEQSELLGVPAQF